MGRWDKMPSQSELEVTLDKISDHVRDLHDEISEENVEAVVVYEDDDGGDLYDFIGHRCSRKDNTYVIAGHPEFEFMTVLSFTSITGYVMTGISEEEADDIINEELKEDANKQRIAALKLLDQIDPDTMEALKSYLYMMASGENYMIDIQTTDQESIDFITTGSKIFPYHDGFGIKDLDTAITSVVNSSEKLIKLIPRTIALSVPGEESEEYELGFNFGW